MNDAYAAGIIDGEGCITIAQHGKGQWFSIRIDVGMSQKSLALLEALQKHYGGSVRQTREATEKWEASSAWGIFGKQAAAFLERITPWLFLKHEQARLALRLQEIWEALPKNANGSAHWTDEARARGATIRLRVQELNRKGPDMTATPKDGWFARLVAGTWVTPQQDLFTDLGWAEFSETWPRAGMTRNGSAYPLLPLVRLTDVTGSSLWPTPQAFDANNINRSPEALTRAMAKGGCSNLREVVKMPERWPTPTARDWRSGKASLATHEKNSRPLNEVAAQGQASGQLNPTWVEWLMGFPEGWSDLED